MGEDQKKIELYLKNNTFYCDKYKARISDRQCMMNCGRTVYNQDMYERRMKTNREHPRYSGIESALLYTHLFKGKTTCVGCDKFKKPDLETQKMISFFQRRVCFDLLSDSSVYPIDEISACSSL